MNTIGRLRPDKRGDVAVLCTNLGKVWSLGASEVDVDQIGFSPERSKSEVLHLLPPGEESGESRVILGDCARFFQYLRRMKGAGKRLTFFTLTRM